MWKRMSPCPVTGDEVNDRHMHIPRTCRVDFFLILVLVLTAFLRPFQAAGGDDFPFSHSLYDVKEHGAKGDGLSSDTRAVQAAIDAAEQRGGGTVLFPPGNYRCGSLHVKSRVRLHLDHGATLLASPDAADFDPPETLAFKNDADKETSFFQHALLC